MRNLNPAIIMLALILSAIVSSDALADEGGVSFWLPGQFGSLVAVPSAPGWALPVLYIHSSATAGATQSFRRGAQITAGLDARSDLLLAFPTYTFFTSVAGGQAGVGAGLGVGPVTASVNAILSAPSGSTLSGSKSETLTGVSDLYPTATLKWNHGNNNFMTYAMAGVPVGTYSVQHIANLGINHWSVDGGGAYTYFDKTNEFSAALGSTYNFKNKDTQYQNGVSSHLDWGASRFISKKTHIGLVGYSYYQLTGDGGAGAVLGEFKSRVSAVGPQVGYFFGKDNMWYANLKGYYEFDARNRAKGWNVWLTLAIP